MKKFFAMLAATVLMTTSVDATTYPVFVIDESASSISINEVASVCIGCTLTAEFSAGVDGASWVPTAPNDFWSISEFIDWTGNGFLGAALYSIEVIIAFSSPDPTATTATGDGLFATLFGVLNAGVVSWDTVSSVSFAQGSTLDVFLEDGALFGLDNTMTTGVTFVGNEVASVPLPATALLLLGSLVGLVLVRRSRQTV